MGAYVHPLPYNTNPTATATVVTILTRKMTDKCGGDRDNTGK